MLCALARFICQKSENKLLEGESNFLCWTVSLWGSTLWELFTVSSLPSGKSGVWANSKCSVHTSVVRAKKQGLIRGCQVSPGLPRWSYGKEPVCQFRIPKEM